MNLERYIGLPFKKHGRGPDGWDCWGLIEHIYERELGLYLPIYEYDDTTHHNAVFFAQQQGHWREVDEPAAYDVVLLTAMRNPHVGLCIDNQRMLHVPEEKTSCVEWIYSPKWKSRIESFYRYYPSHSTH